MSPEPPILQFGTGRFLQAHVDLFVSQASERGEALGGITVVQSSGQPAAVARMQALARAEGYPVIVRGLAGGAPLERHETGHAVREALDARVHWHAVRERMRGPVRVLVSNTADQGWQLEAADGPHLLPDAAPAPAAFPAKLLVLLHDRWHARPDAELTLLPCELVSRNGNQLRAIVVTLAREWGCAPAFIDWLQRQPVWANSLVDRIVSQALEPVGAVAEPYALWAIEQQPRLVLPCRHPAIVLTDDLDRFERRKLFLLNLGHTLLADAWMKQAHPADMTVLQAMQTPALRDALEAAWREEVLPVLDALGDGPGARAYLVELRDRLLNPFLAHRLADIAQNHAQKKARRIEPCIALARTRVPALAQPRLRAAMAAT
ncbi:mannitol dehydrogenase family protein [Aquincola sp. S2]|uniref:Mannitol dehydrogenase family protein n=1 Tax=Pseudaquabacterium terrae TaxID=2732868 RepID=A0ABX2ERB8_9BURK|nr:mannitol dehydrogenase family protein [Aquabacterium terrae]NRF71153.1 mannitol dehydrogenase family protein [Aquabacterium terrae]